MQADRDPLRSAAARLRVQSPGQWPEGKLKKAERELLSYLELHPGSHNLAEVDEVSQGRESKRRARWRDGRFLTWKSKRPLSASHPFKAAANVEPPSGGGVPSYPPGGRSRRASMRSCCMASPARARRKSISTPIEHAGARPQRAAAGARDRADACRGGPVLSSLRRPGVAILHSAFHDAERAEQWRRIRNGQARVVVGTRSGVFAPVQNLGLIIIDEEHDGSYKQQDTPRYNGRDVAMCARISANACVVLGSATPSLETRYNVERGKYTLLELPERIENRPMPEVELIDMRIGVSGDAQAGHVLAPAADAIGEKLETGEQVMLLHNRRGFSSFVACRSCGERVQCVNCSVTLTFHARDRRMLCHYCSYAERVPSLARSARASISISSVSARSAWRTNCIANFPQRASRGWIATRSPGKRHFETILTGFRETSIRHSRRHADDRQGTRHSRT